MVYFLLWLADITMVLKLLSILALLVAAFVLIAVLVEQNKEIKVVKKIVNILIISAILAIFVPSKSTVYMITGAYLSKQVATSTNIDDKLSKVAKMIDMKLEEYLKNE